MCKVNTFLISQTVYVHIHTLHELEIVYTCDGYQPAVISLFSLGNNLCERFSERSKYFERKVLGNILVLIAF